MLLGASRGAGRHRAGRRLRRARRAGNILYDRDDGGEFFQLYSRTFAGGMFFEVLERRGGYAGYGAANAPFRIAAQQRLRGPKGLPRR